MNAVEPVTEIITTEPYYAAQGDEVTIFEAAWRNQLPVLLKGPTGCGKTRFMEYMAWRLHRPLVTVSCHDDLTSADLVGRYLICLLYTSPSPRDQRGSRMPSSA